MAKLISKTYGDALFTLAVEENKIDELVQEITQLLDILKKEEEFSKLMNHPRVPVEEKINLVKEIFTGRISSELVGFLTLVVTKGRYSSINEILQYFIDSAKEFKGIGVVYVTTPLLLNDGQKSAITKKLLQTTQYKEMEMHYAINQELIGGMQIRIKDRVVDSSIQTKILKMQQNLMQIQLYQFFVRRDSVIAACIGMGIQNKERKQIHEFKTRRNKFSDKGSDQEICG